MVAQFYSPIAGGEERMTESLSIALSARGHHVAVATLRHPGQAATEELNGITVHRLPGLAQRLGSLYSEGGRRHAPPAPDPETVLALRRVVVAERPDVVHGHNWLTHAYLPLQRRGSAAYVMTLHDYSLVCANKRFMRMGEPCSGPGPRKCVICAASQYGRLAGPAVAVMNQLSGRAERRAVDLFLPVSHEVARRTGLAGGTAPFEVMPNFLNDPTWAGAPGDPSLAPLPHGDFILYAGDLAPDKGVGMAIEAHARLAARVPLVLAGRSFGEGLGTLPENVIGLGLLPHDAVLAAWRRCAIGVVPSITPDAFPVSALEAMAAGAPLVASNVGGLPDFVVDGESGILVPPGDVGALAGALDRLLADPPLRRRIGAAAATRVAEHFTAAAVVPRIEAAYERAIATRARRRAGSAVRDAAA